MEPGLTITIVDPDDDYLGIEIQASNDRFAGSTWIYAGLKELSEFTDQIAGFPANAQDERTYVFGDHDPKSAGGYCSLRFRCLDQAGHPAIEIDIEDDDQRYTTAIAHLSFRVEAAAIDQFSKALRHIESHRSGEAVLSSSD